MWIQELYLKNFGKFSNEKIILGPGINLIYGENESGKSTLHGFIRGCLFGMRKMRGRASKTDMFNRYQSWENPAYYAGNMRFVCGDKVFRLERDFSKPGKNDQLVCETDGERLSLGNGDLEMLLGNVGEITFDNTVSIGQLKSETDDGLAVELKNYMANMESAGDGAVRVEKAVIQLKDRKRHLEKQIREKHRLEEENIRNIEAHLQFLREECEKEKRERVHMQKLLSEADDNQKKTGFLKRLLQGILRFFKRLFGKETISEKDKILGKIEHLENQIQEKEVQIRNYYQEIETQKQSIYTDGKSKEQIEIEACNLAMNRIQEVVSKMQMDVGLFLKKRTSEIFAELTEGRYPFVEISEDLRLGVHEAQRYVALESLSRGTIWQLYFALRMAANEVLCQEENLPVILDDAFAMYDERRMGQTLGWLSKQKKQVIIFTCHKREKEWLLGKGIPFQEIRLTR